MYATSLVLLWMALGCASAALLPVSTESRWAWVPVAAFLGPLWFFVATEMRAPTPELQSVRAVDGSDHPVRCTCGARS